MTKEKYIEKEYWLGTEEEYHAGADYAFYELCKELDVPSEDIRKSKDTIDGIAARLAVRINETINERLHNLEKENNRLREELKHAADLLETECNNCPIYIDFARHCPSMCDVLTACRKIRSLTEE